MTHVPVDLSALAERLTVRLREANPERQLEFAIEPGLQVRGDSALLEVALGNLLDNAVKFTRNRPRARIELARTGPSDRPVYVVRDNGAGFDSASAQNLFGAFQRMHRTSEFPGTGIGLATVRRIIDRHGGRIWAESRPDQGATLANTPLEARRPSHELRGPCAVLSPS